MAPTGRSPSVVTGLAADAGVVGGVAIDTPAHLERRDLHRSRLLGHVAVAGGTFYPRQNVGLVGKAHEIRHVMDLGPADGVLRVILFFEEFDRVFVGGDQLMTAHTGVHRRDARDGGAACPTVAILAGDFILARVESVREFGNGLLRVIADIFHGIAGREGSRPGLAGGCRGVAEVFELVGIVAASNAEDHD